MRKKLLMTLWLLVPIFVLAFHYGPGQKGLIRDRAAEKIKAAMKAEKEEDWSGAVAAYDEALSILPGDQKELRFKLQCAHANARMFSGQLPEAIGELEGLLADMLKQGAPAERTREVRGTLASAEYYAGWLMRLESGSAMTRE